MIYLLKQDGTTEEYKEAKIGKYFSVSENRFQEDIRLYGEVVICDLLFKVLNRYRELKGEAGIGNIQISMAISSLKL